MSDAAAGGAGGAGAVVTGNPVGQPGPVRMKVSDMSRAMSHGTPGTVNAPTSQQAPLPQAPAPMIVHQGQSQQFGPQGGAQEGFDANGNPDLGFGGDLDAQADGRGAELEAPDFSNSAEMEVDDSHMAELVDPDAYTQLKAKFDADDLAPEFDSKWVEVPVKNGDGSTRMERMTVAELKAGNMMQADYSNKLAEVAAIRRDVLAARAGQNLLMEHLSQPQTFLQAMHNLGKFEVFEAAAELYAVHERLPLEQLRAANPVAYQHLIARRAADKKALQLEIRANQLAQQAQQAQQAAQQAQPAAGTQQIANQLAQMFPIAKERAGVERACQSPVFKLIWDEPVAPGVTQGERIFSMHWANMLPTLQGHLTTDFVTEVMKAALQTVGQIARETAPKRDPRLPPPNQGVPGRATVPAGQPGQPSNGRMPARAKIGDMDRLLRGQR